MQDLNSLWEDEPSSAALNIPNSILHLFPTLSPADILNLLQSFNFDISAAVESFSNGNCSSGKSTTVCRHFLAGSCYRADCWYSHELSDTICKFWLAGSCLKGNECSFAHSEIANRISIPKPSISLANQHWTPASDHVSVFPSLGNSNTGVSVKLESVSKFASYDKNACEDSDQNVESNSEFPALGATPKVKSNNQSSFKNYRDVTTLKKTPMRINIAKEAPAAFVTSKKKVEGIQWAATGGTIDSLYKNTRKEAEAASIERNKLFQRATEAYLSGNKLAAKTFSKKAHEMDELAKRLHNEASEAIFTKRNTQSLSSEFPTIDLHGLHSEEAITFLSKSLNKYKQNIPGHRKFVGTVAVIVGTRHHSQRKGDLANDIKDFLKESGWKFKIGDIGDSRGGIFLVEIT